MSDIKNMTPKQIVAELDKYIIGQDDAKKHHHHRQPYLDIPHNAECLSQIISPEFCGIRSQLT